MAGGFDKTMSGFDKTMSAARGILAENSPLVVDLERTRCSRFRYE